MMRPSSSLSSPQGTPQPPDCLSHAYTALGTVRGIALATPGRDVSITSESVNWHQVS